MLRSNAENPGEGEEATAPSNIIKVQIIHGGKEMPPNGGIVFPENVQVKPLVSSMLDWVSGSLAGR